MGEDIGWVGEVGKEVGVLFFFASSSFFFFAINSWFTCSFSSVILFFLFSFVFHVPLSSPVLSFVHFPPLL